jgi:hypothetical protein
VTKVCAIGTQLKRVIAASATLGILRRDQHVVLRIMSQSGCLIDADQSIELGVVGVLRLEVDEVEYSDLVRVSRCHAVPGQRLKYQIGLEFVWTDAPGERSLRRLSHRFRRIAGAMPRRAQFSGPGADRRRD